MRILVVEDEDLLAEALVEALEDECYAVDLAKTGGEAEELASINEYDLVVLDWSIPPPTGVELLAEWRSRGLEMPVLMLTGRTGVKDRVDGLDSGADDYLTKPFSFVEFFARIRSLLRRRHRGLQPELEAGDVQMDRAARHVTVTGQTIDLSEHVWDDRFDSFSNVIDVTVHRMRKKIDGDRKKRLLHTVKGVGYVLRSERS